MRQMPENAAAENAAAAQPTPPRRARMIPRGVDDRIQVIAMARPKQRWNDLYVRLLDGSWGALLLYIAGAYLSVNTLFGLLYYLGGNSIENARPGHYADAFFFSVQTLATIGYGKMVPEGLYTNMLVTAEAFLGFTFYAMVTGLVFSKFSRPSARVLFSNVAVICPYHGVPHLMLRMANERRNRIVDATAQVVLLHDEVSPEGQRMRRFTELPLVRAQVPLMQLTWLVMHRVDSLSPLYQLTSADLVARKAEIIVSLSGLDESFSQTIHARFSYLGEEIRIGHMFEDVLVRRPDQAVVEVHYDRFHDTRPFQPQPPAPHGPRAEDDAAFQYMLRICNPD